MTEIVIRESHIVWDACCILTCADTGEFQSVLTAFQQKSVVSSFVYENEVLSTINLSGDEISFDLKHFVQKGDILVEKLDQVDEQDAIYKVNFQAQRLDEGEAESAAIAVSRGWAIATDDRKARTVISLVSPHTRILSTPEIIKHWAERLELPSQRVRAAIQSIRRFVPSPSHPLLDWWQQYI